MKLCLLRENGSESKYCLGYKMDTCICMTMEFFFKHLLAFFHGVKYTLTYILMYLILK